MDAVEGEAVKSSSACVEGTAEAEAAKQEELPQGGDDPPSNKPLSLTEADKRKQRKKLQEFKDYLVSTRVIQTLVQLLLEMKEADPLPEDPQQVLINYFGEYRDPVLDLIDSLNEKKETLKAEKESITRRIEALEQTREALQEQNYQQKLWKAIAKTGTSVTSMALYQRLADRKKPRGPLKNVSFTQGLFLRLLGSIPQARRRQQPLLAAAAVAADAACGMAAQMLEALCPSGDPAESLPSAGLKDDGDNPVLNAVSASSSSSSSSSSRTERVD
ncbi:hypothetical protein Efla_003003 [Eimeria flavescens]